MSDPILGKVQIGLESVHGTAVPATVLVPITQGPLPVDRKVTEIPYDVGANAAATGHVQQGVIVNDTLSWDFGAFQLLPWLFSGGILGNVTPEEQTAGEGDYLWEHEPSLDADNEVDSFTIERGDTINEVDHAYAMFKRLHLSGQINQDGGESAVKLEVDYFAKENAANTFTAGLSPLDMTYMNAKLARVYLDTSWAGLGGTELASILRSFDLDIVTGVHPSFNGGAQETFDSHEAGPMSFMLTLTMLRGAATEALRQAIGVMKFARIDINGPRIGTGVYHRARFDLAGYIEDVVAMASTDRTKSANLDTVVLHGQLDPTSGKLFSASVITDLASIG